MTILCKYDINPYYCQIINNNAIGLEFSGELPSKLYTYLGYINLPYTSACSTGHQQDLIVKQLVNEYGAVLIQKKVRIHHDFYGPIYSITRLPWSSEKLPLFKYKKFSEYTESDEAQRIFEQLLSELYT